MNESTHSRVALLRLLGIAREDNELLLVRLQPLNIQLLPLLTEVPPAVVNDDTNTARLLPANTGFLEFRQREATSLTDFAVVAHSLSTDGGAQVLEWADAENGGLGLASAAPAELAAGLVEPGLDAALPVLAEMVAVEDVVVRETHLRNERLLSAFAQCFIHAEPGPSNPFCSFHR